VIFCAATTQLYLRSMGLDHLREGHAKCFANPLRNENWVIQYHLSLFSRRQLAQHSGLVVRQPHPGRIGKQLEVMFSGIRQSLLMEPVDIEIEGHNVSLSSPFFTEAERDEAARAYYTR
jgi:hypothetical protein